MNEINIQEIVRYPSEYFGLPDQRRFPMYTKEELDGAVRNFNLCPEADKSTLVNAIKARIEALDLKVAFKGQLMRHFDVRKYPVAEATTIYEASNVGTLEPIVGAIPTKTQVLRKPIPAEEFNTLDDTHKLVTLVADEDIKVEENADGYGTTMTLSDRAKSFFEKELFDFNERNEIPTQVKNLIESIQDQTERYLDAVPYMVSYESVETALPADIITFINIILNTNTLSAEERGLRIGMLLKRGGLSYIIASIIIGLLDRSDCADIATTIVNYLKVDDGTSNYSELISILGREYSPEELEATENPVTITPGFPEKIKEQILEKEIPEGIEEVFRSLCQQEKDLRGVNHLIVYEILRSDHPEYGLFSHPDTYDYLWVVADHTVYCARAYIDLATYTINVYMYPLFIFDDEYNMEITMAYRKLFGEFDPYELYLTHMKIEYIENMNSMFRTDTVDDIVGESASVFDDFKLDVLNAINSDRNTLTRELLQNIDCNRSGHPYLSREYILEYTQRLLEYSRGVTLDGDTSIESMKNLACDILYAIVMIHRVGCDTEDINTIESGLRGSFRHIHTILVKHLPGFRIVDYMIQQYNERSRKEGDTFGIELDPKELAVTYRSIISI